MTAASTPPDELLPRIARLLAEGARELDEDGEIVVAMAALSIISVEQKWYYLWLLFLAASRDDASGVAEEYLGPIADETLVQALLFNHRINDAIAIEFGQREQSGRVNRTPLNIRLPARRWNFPGTDRWITAETLREVVEDIRRVARTLPVARRRAWIERELVRRFRELNDRIKDGAAMQLMRHASALNGMQWRRLTKDTRSEVVHVRLHFASAFLTASLRSGDLTARVTQVLPSLFMHALSEEARAAVDSHFAPRMLGDAVYRTLCAIRSRSSMETLLPLLQGLYSLLLQRLFERPDVAARLASLGERPTLVVSTHGPLAQLPFAALHDGERYLIERFNIVQAPPLYSDRDFEAGEIDYEALTGGEPIAHPEIRVLADTVGLKQTPHEIEAYERFRHSRGAQITVLPEEQSESWGAQTLRQLFAPKGMALLSAHVHASAEDVNSTALVDPKGHWIRFSEGLVSPIAVDLLVLAGCVSTAQTDWFSGGEGSLVSLCRRAGAKAVVATLWPVDDRAARLYNEALVSQILDGAPRAVAHANAQRAVMKATMTIAQIAFDERLVRQESASDMERVMQEAPLTYEHPYFWAPFSLSGAWR